MRRPLAAAALAAALAAVPLCAWADEALVGEGVGEGLYSRVEKGGYAAERAFLDQALVGSARELNAKVAAVDGLRTRVCGTQNPDCRVFSKDVGADALLRASQGDLGPVIAAMNPTVRAPIEAGTLAELAKILNDYAASKQEDVARAARASQSLSMIGLYVDGDVDNSEYDIVADVEKINQRLFGKPVEYQGPVNRSADAAGDLVSGPFLGGSNSDYGPDAQDAVASNGFAYKDAAARQCPAPAWSGGLVAEVNALLDPQNAQDGGAGIDPLAAAGLSTGKPVPKGRKQGDCDGEFFCMDVQFLTYRQNLLGYVGRPKSVENVVDKHLAHVEKQAGKSFVQSTHATAFGELPIGGDLKRFLLDNLSFKVEVNYLPPPFLASKGATPPATAPTDWDAAGALNDYLEHPSGDQLGVANLVMRQFQDAGLGADPARTNLLFLNQQDLRERMAVANSEGGTADAATQKIWTAEEDSAARDSARAVQEVAGEAYLGGQAAKKLDDQLLEISSFTNALRLSVEKLATIVHSMAKKK